MNFRTLVFGKGNHLGRRLIILTIAFSSAITLCISVVQLLIEYRGLRNAMDRQLDSIAIYVPTIEGSVWDFDEKQIQRAIDALVLLPDVATVHVRSQDTHKAWTAGKEMSANTITRTYSLRHIHRGLDTEIGTLEIVASLDVIHQQVIASAISILVSNSIKTALVVLFMIVLIRRLLTRRLEVMASKVHSQVAAILPSSQHADPAVAKIPPGLDELDEVNWALDKTTADLGIAVGALHHLNESLDQTVKERTQALEAAIKELKAFSYTLSHDMKSPLRAMSGYGKILSDEYGDRLGEEGNWMVTRIIAAAERMDTLINDTLGLYRVSETSFKQETIDLSKIAREVVAQLAETDPRRTVAWHIEDGMLDQGDPGLMRTALENLIGNAWKYSSKKEAPEISFGTRKQEDGSKLYFVKDNGAGFDMTYSNNLFVPFQRLHRDTDFPGNGVGLATARKIISRHKGRVWGEGKIGEGATFYFTLNEVPPAEETR